MTFVGLLKWKRYPVGAEKRLYLHKDVHLLLVLLTRILDTSNDILLRISLEVFFLHNVIHRSKENDFTYQNLRFTFSRFYFYNFEDIKVESKKRKMTFVVISFSLLTSEFFFFCTKLYTKKSAWTNKSKISKDM